MGYISIDAMSFRYQISADLIFKDLQIAIDTRWKLGLIGRNGIGKTTLLKLIHGSLIPSHGQIRKAMPTLCYPYDLSTVGKSTEDVIKDSLGPYRALEAEMEALETLVDQDEAAALRYAECLAHYHQLEAYGLKGRILKELDAMELPERILEQPFASLSGGEQSKIKVLSLFLRPQFFLLIDEPTNHLDLEGRASLAAYLRQKKGFMLVSHDQAFLDASVDHILLLDQQGAQIHRGNFSRWNKLRILSEARKSRQTEVLEKQGVALASAARSMRGWGALKEGQKMGAGDKGHIGAKAAKLMRRAKRMEKRRDEIYEEIKQLNEGLVHPRRLDLKQPIIKHQCYLRAQNLGYQIKDKLLFQNLSFELRQGDRLWIRGANGSGKSSLLKILAGELGTSQGRLRKHPDLRIAYARQDLPASTMLVADYGRLREVDKTLFLTQLDYFDMGPEFLDKRMHEISEGEQKKVEIAAALSKDAELYLWDELLNYMDLYFRIQLERAIKKHQPTLVFVTHDEAFGQAIATQERVLRRRAHS